MVRPATTDAQGGETEPNLVDPLEGLIDPFFGHGTFIAGIIRQTCPDARLLSVKIMDNDGIVEEADLINAIGFIHQRQQKAREDGPDKDLVDILSLSLGYYHEATEEGIRYDTTLSNALDALGRAGNPGRGRGRQQRHHQAAAPGRIHAVPQRCAAGRRPPPR